MPLNVSRFYSLLFLVVLGSFASANGQTIPAPSPSPNTTAAQTEAVPPVKVPTAGEIMRERISKAKAFIAVRNYSAANYELESIRRESNDPSVLAVVNVLLMNSYLEQGDYKRAQDFLNEAYNIQKTTKPGAAANYFTIASQIVKGARNRVERYRALGLNVSDRTLPLEAVNDLEKMRETLELVVTQSKEISKDKAKTPDAMALLEEATTSRSMMARDDYDARKWTEEVADAREDLASSRSVVLSAVTETPTTQPGTDQTAAATQQKPVVTDTSFKQAPVSTQNPNTTANKPADNTVAGVVKPTVMQQPVNQPPQYTPNNNRVANQPNTQAASNTQPATPATQPVTKPVDKPATPNVAQNQPEEQPVKQAEQPAAKGPSTDAAPKDANPLEVGSLLTYATKQQQPVYPVAARSLRTTGVVKVQVTVDEEGNVAEVQNVTGPALLQSAAKDAIKKWHFKPFVRDGQPVKAIGFVSFNFSL